jgi:hypothetical protein
MNAVKAMIGVVVFCGAAAADAPPAPDLAKAMSDIGGKVTRTEKVKSGELVWAEYPSRNRKYSMYTGLSGDKERVWVHIQLVRLDEAAAARHPARLARLLALTRDIGPNHFNLAAGSKTLDLSGSIESRDFQNFRLRELIESMIGDLEQTRADWDIDWSKDPAAPTPPPAPATTRK